MSMEEKLAILLGPNWFERVKESTMPSKSMVQSKNRDGEQVPSATKA